MGRTTSHSKAAKVVTFFSQKKTHLRGGSMLHFLFIFITSTSSSNQLLHVAQSDPGCTSASFIRVQTSTLLTRRRLKKIIPIQRWLLLLRVSYLYSYKWRFLIPHFFCWTRKKWTVLMWSTSLLFGLYWVGVFLKVILSLSVCDCFLAETLCHLTWVLRCMYCTRVHISLFYKENNGPVWKNLFLQRYWLSVYTAKKRWLWLWFSKSY